MQPERRLGLKHRRSWWLPSHQSRQPCGIDPKAENPRGGWGTESPMAITIQTTLRFHVTSPRSNNTVATTVGAHGTLEVIATASSRQGTYDDAPFVEDVEVPPLHLLDVIVAGDRGPAPSTALRPQVQHLVQPQQEGRGTCLKPSLYNTPRLTKPQQLS